MVAGERGLLVALASGAALAGCGGAGCPDGTTVRGGEPPHHAARWCERGPAGPAEEPQVAFRPLGPLRVPAPSPSGEARLEGPFTTFYPNGKPESHGAYAVHGGRSLPHGMWTFWLADGSRQAQGRFHMGDPVGCFASWSGAGGLTTGIADHGEIQPADCDPPRHEEADLLEAAHGGAARPRGDIAFQTFVAPGAELGARSTRFTPRDPAMTSAFSVILRRRFGAARFGGEAAIRLSDSYDYMGSSVTAVGGWGAQPARWLAVDVWGELGGLFLWARPELEGVGPSHGRIFLWTPLTAAQAEASWRLRDRIELSLAGRFELRIPRDVEKKAEFCGAFSCIEQNDTWSLGGVALGAVLGLRFVFW